MKLQPNPAMWYHPAHYSSTLNSAFLFTALQPRSCSTPAGGHVHSRKIPSFASPCWLSSTADHNSEAVWGLSLSKLERAGLCSTPEGRGSHSWNLPGEAGLDLTHRHLWGRRSSNLPIPPTPLLHIQDSALFLPTELWGIVHLLGAQLIQPSDPASASFTWTLGDYSDCSALCGGGQQSRDVTCTDTRNNPVPAGLCPQPAPATVRGCNEQPCSSSRPADFKLVFGAFGACVPSCGEGNMTRTVTCQSKDGYIGQLEECGQMSDGEGGGLDRDHCDNLIVMINALRFSADAFQFSDECQMLI